TGGTCPGLAPHTPGPHHGPSEPSTTHQKRCGAPQLPPHAARAPPNRSAHESGSRSTNQTDTPPAPPTRRPHPAPAPTPPPRHRAATSPPAPATPPETAHRQYRERSC